MLGRGHADETVQLECPTCGARVEVTIAEAEKGKVRCPKGHEVIVMGTLGVPGLGDPKTSRGGDPQ
jgi:hypothetical protein